ncbi:Na_Ca_ex-domain-containing protein, partial [Fragilariopsis cylindrus CCMP1102]
MDITKDLYHSSGLVINNKLNWLLIMGPIALLGDATGLLGETACFAFSGIALIPCAERLSFVTEQVAEHTNGTIGALLNATFGNAPELLIASAALRKGFYRVVQLAMLGSMLTNLLFVFGVSCLIGGLRWQVQELRITSGNVSVGMLLLSVAGSLLPATLILGGQLKKSSSSSSSDKLQFCRVNAFVMIFMYGCYLIFQLGTHKEEFDEDENVVQTANHTQLHLSPHFTSLGILWLFIITCGVSAMSDILVDTIDGFAIRLRISEVFTSMVIVPFFSNVAEQVSAILFAYRNEMDLAVGVTVGSAIQVASFVLPGCVIMGWLFDRSMTLYFHAYETVSLFLAVIVVAAVLQGGTTNWLVGATCISVYVMIAS